METEKLNDIRADSETAGKVTVKQHDSATQHDLQSLNDTAYENICYRAEHSNLQSLQCVGFQLAGLK